MDAIIEEEGKGEENENVLEKQPNEDEKHGSKSVQQQLSKISKRHPSEEQVKIKQVFSKKYISNYDIDLVELAEESSMLVGGQNRNMSV
jgi:3-methyladenine DNA glycosylase AlkC